MLRRIQKWVAGVGLATFLFAGAGAVVSAYYGPWSFNAIVPSFGTPPWYSAQQTASGNQQYASISSIGGSYDGAISSWISNSNYSRISPSFDIYSGKTFYYNSSASAGQKIAYSLKTHFWVPVNVQVRGSWGS